MMFSLMLSMLGKSFSRQQFEIFLLIFFQKIEFDISCKLSSIETICVKCKILFSGKIRKNVTIFHTITKPYLYNVDPLKPHFYIVKLGFTGVYINFLIFAQNIDYGYSLQPPRRGSSNEYQQTMF